MQVEEIWAPVPGYENAYEVSTLGRVRSLPGGRRRPRVLKAVPSGRGYLTHQLSSAGVAQRHYVHHMVAIAFMGSRPERMDICHNNGDFTDNRLNNLRYDTVSANNRDSVEHGTNHQANKSRCPQGHEFGGDNLRLQARLNADGRFSVRRVCRACIRDAQRRLRAKRMASV